jgi:hypothetical protein
VTAANTLRPASNPWRSVWLSWFLPCSGICVALVAVAWYLHWEALVRVAPGLPAMKLNAALCFVLCGVAVVLVTTNPAAYLAV